MLKRKRHINMHVNCYICTVDSKQHEEILYMYLPVGYSQV